MFNLDYVCPICKQPGFPSPSVPGCTSCANYLMGFSVGYSLDSKKAIDNLPLDELMELSKMAEENWI